MENVERQSIYVFGDETKSLFKIGVSADPRTRVPQIIIIKECRIARSLRENPKPH